MAGGGTGVTNYPAYLQNIHVGLFSGAVGGPDGNTPESHGGTQTDFTQWATCSTSTWRQRPASGARPTLR